ncbi:MAG: anaerobic sulfatase maturase [Victivallaceae bacterium]|nr:anaerobic sulfatase maturase [Victivallaceae bacterium]
MKEFSLLIKPASCDCNLRCKYCFYLRKQEFFGSCRHRMSDEVLEKLISSFTALEMPRHLFSWQGGEPTLMGADFFRKALELMYRSGRGKKVVNTLQTNGMLLNDDWGQLLHDYNFLVGVSLDGLRSIHDENRRGPGGEGSHQQVLGALKLLERHKVEFNILTLVNRTNVSRPLEIYRYLKKLGIRYHQYIECVEYLPDGRLAPFAITGPEWGRFMSRIFDEWYRHDRYSVSVRLFDTILTKLLDRQAVACSMGRDCRQYLVIEYNGDVYPCDFFVEPRFKLGNILENSWEELLTSPLYEKFGLRKRASDEHCSACEWLELCAGCCPKNRPDYRGEARALSELCAGWKMFYVHTIGRFKSLAAEIRQQRDLEYQAQIHRQVLALAGQGKISLEAPCPCGSGKPLKECAAAGRFHG